MRCRRHLAISAFLLAVATFGCQVKQPQSQATVGSDADPKLLAAKLEDAYRASSPEMLAAFFENWHHSVRPANVKEIHDPLERELYSLFQSFFKPSGLNAIAGGNGYGDVVETYERVEYVILQNTLHFRLGQRASEEESSVTNFRPPVKSANHRVLYLTPCYREALVAFLDADDTSGAYGVDNTLKRVRFLDRFVSVSPGHWSGWDLLTPPTVDLVELDQTTTEAKVHFTILSDGGVTSMKRTPDGWQIVDTGIFWMQ